MRTVTFTLEERIHNIESFILYLSLFLLSIYLIINHTYLLDNAVGFFALLISTILFYIYSYIYFVRIVMATVIDTHISIKKFIIKYNDQLKYSFRIVAIIIIYLILTTIGVELKDIVTGIISSIIALYILKNYDKALLKLKEWRGK